MATRIAADATLLLHLAFVLFVVGGAVLALRARWMPFVHLPAAVWGAVIECTAGTCPLTSIENRLRVAAGEAGYPGGFVEHYLVPLIYPAGLTPGIQWMLGAGVVVLNGVVYAWLVRRGTWRRGRG